MTGIRRIEAFVKHQMPKRKRVAAYARVSMDTEKLLHSLSAQVSHFSDQIQSNKNWDFAGVYADEGVSGRRTSRRTEFQRLMADCDAGKIDIVLAKSVSRFARDTVDCLSAVRHLRDIGIEVRFEREGISSFSKDGELLLTLLASFAQAESDSQSENSKWAARKRFMEGRANTYKPPYGYRWDGEMFRIIPEQGAVVKRVYAMYLAGESAYSIAKKLKAEGVAGQGGGPMCDATIKDMVTNPSYTGTMVLQKWYFTERHVRKHNKGELPRYEVEGMYEPLVSKEDYQRAMEIRECRAARMPNAHPVLTRFSGLVKCGKCGGGVSRRTLSNKRKAWKCNASERKGRMICDVHHVHEDELEAAAILAVGEMDDAAFRRTVRQIVLHDDRIEFCFTDGKEKNIPRKRWYLNGQDGFSGKLFCGMCGKPLRRKAEKNGQKRRFLFCQNPHCPKKPKKLPEADFRRAAKTMLKTSDCESAFVGRVRRAVLSDSSVSFEFKDGKVKSWQRK